MATLDAAELYNQSVLKNAQELVKHDRVYEALEALHFLVTSRHRNASWNRFHEEAMHLHITLAVKLRREAHIRAAMHSYRMRVMHLNTSVLAELLEHLSGLLDGIIAEACVPVSTPSVEDTIVLQMTGRSAQDSIAARRRDQTFHFVVEATKAALASINSTGKYETYFQSFIRHVMTHCVEHGRNYEFNQISEFLRKHLARAFDNQDQRNVIINAPDSIRSIVLTKQHQLQAAAKLRHWPAVLGCIDAMRDIIALLRRCEKPIKLQDLVPYYASLTEIFRGTGNLHFFAHCAIRYANFQLRSGVDDKEAAVYASQAVLATVCVQEEISDIATDRNANLTRAFGLTSTPNRESLLEDVLRPSPTGNSLLEISFDATKTIFHAIQRQTGAGIFESLEALEKKSATLAIFKPIVTSAALESAVALTAQNASSVNIEHLATACAVPVEKFATQIEPVILHSAQLRQRVAASIDLKNGCVRFNSAVGAGDRVIGLQGLFAKQLAEAVSSAEPKKQPNRLVCPRAQLVKRLAAERQRVIARNFVCIQRIERAEDRAIQEKKKEEERKKSELRKRQEIEEQRVAKMREQQEAQLQKRVEELEAIERRKWVLSALMKKHRNFDVPMSLAHKSDTVFADEVSRRLTAFRRETELTKESDVRTMNHYERACREVEIPKREQLERDEAEKTARALEARKANMRLQHRADWEQRIATKQRLLRFKEQKEQYEGEIKAVMGKALSSKVAKRDVEQSELDQMKREKEEAAARAAAATAKPAEPEPEPAREEKAAEPAKAEGGPKPAKWVPKSRKA